MGTMFVVTSAMLDSAKDDVQLLNVMESDLPCSVTGTAEVRLPCVPVPIHCPVAAALLAPATQAVLDADVLTHHM